MPLMKRGSAPVVDAATQPVGIVTTSTTAPELTQKTTAKLSSKAGSDTMSKADWAAKDVRISRQGLFQAALQSTGLLQLNTGNTFEDYMALVEKTVERGLQFVNRG